MKFPAFTEGSVTIFVAIIVHFTDAQQYFDYLTRWTLSCHSYEACCGRIAHCKHTWKSIEANNQFNLKNGGNEHRRVAKDVLPQICFFTLWSWKDNTTYNYKQVRRWQVINKSKTFEIRRREWVRITLRVSKSDPTAEMWFWIRDTLACINVCSIELNSIKESEWDYWDEKECNL